MPSTHNSWKLLSMTANRATDGLTHVELYWREKQIERWIRFGQEVGDKIVDRRRRVLSFAPNTTLAFVRWASNGYGTVVSRIDILRTVPPGEGHQTLPLVSPAGEILLRISGWPKVARVLQIIDAVEAIGVDATEVAPDYWRHVHNRFLAGEEPRRYTPDQHRAWLLRQRAFP